MKYSPADSGVVITMAGAGSRFAQAGYSVPKYEIPVHGRTLFEWSLESLRSFIDAGSRFIFVAQARTGVDTFISRQSEKLGIRQLSIIELPGITDGQATTAMHARSAWDDPNRPLVIYNIDTFVHPRALHVEDVRGSGWLPCFPGEGDKWSFAATGSNSRVSEVREKKRISNHATIGLYWFDSFARYATAYEHHYADPRNLEAKERYIAPLYNRLVQEGLEVYIQEISADDVFPLGTPEDVSAFAHGPAPELRGLASVL